MLIPLQEIIKLNNPLKADRRSVSKGTLFLQKYLLSYLKYY